MRHLLSRDDRLKDSGTNVPGSTVPRSISSHVHGADTGAPGLARTVSLFLKQEVVDQTGLTGYYDFDLRWEAPRVEGAPPPSSRLGDDGIAMFLSTLREELGLRFSKGKAPARSWVVDAVEPPTEN